MPKRKQMPKREQIPKTGRVLVLLLATAAIAACTAPPKTVQFSGSIPARSDRDYENWKAKPFTAERLMEHEEFEVLSLEPAGSGTTRPEKGELHFPKTGDHFHVKGKLAPSSLDGFNNSPRKELAAWKLQALFLDPVDFTVPSSAMRCTPLPKWNERHDDDVSNVAGTDCMLWEAAIWLENVTVPDRLYEEERFLNDLAYAYHLANFNIFAYLINLRDNRTGNVLVSKNESNRRVFAIDNGVAFGTIWYNWFYPPTYAWRQIRVPALPRQSIDRLRNLNRANLDFLMVVSQLELGEDGIMRSVKPGPPIDPLEGATRDGGTIQFGLTRDEIDAIWSRIEELIERVDAGEIGLF
jgi:hypothetical protein